MSEGVFIPDADITETGADGVERLVAAKGVPVQLARARQLGLIKDQQAAGPQETKAEESPAKPTKSAKADKVDEA